jgi:hypothetical protein
LIGIDDSAQLVIAIVLIGIFFTGGLISLVFAIFFFGYLVAFLVIGKALLFGLIFNSNLMARLMI